MKNKISVLALTVAVISVWACKENEQIEPRADHDNPLVASKSIAGTSFTMAEVSKEEHERSFEAMKKDLAQ